MFAIGEYVEISDFHNNPKLRGKGGFIYDIDTNGMVKLLTNKGFYKVSVNMLNRLPFKPPKNRTTKKDNWTQYTASILYLLYRYTSLSMKEISKIINKTEGQCYNKVYRLEAYKDSEEMVKALELAKEISSHV